MPPESERVQLASLPVQQLQSIRERLDRELEHFGQSAGILNRTSQLFQGTSKAIESLSQSKEGQPLLLPLTSSLYVSGSLVSTDTVMVDIGTGYYAEMTAKEAQDYCSRRVNKVAENLQNLQQILRQKQGQLMTINSIISERMQRNRQEAA